ncbi:MAG: AI-2E family transporter [Maricaulaceae bacterium]|jgi:predicted PurR-regulated permease PerM
MDATTRASALFIAIGVGVAGLYFFRDILAPFALAVFLWLIMDGFANAIRRFSAEMIPRRLALGVAVVVVFAGAAAVIAVITSSAADFARQSTAYAQRIDQLINELYVALSVPNDAPTVSEYLSETGVGGFFRQLAGTVQGVASNALFVFIYVAFLFAAQATFPKKMSAIFRDQAGRSQAKEVIGRVRVSMERYLAVQTFVSAITAATCYVTLSVLGLENPLFWAFLIFLFNYIPTVGSIVATILPVLFALVQFDTLWQPAAVLVGVGFWQFLIGNFIQPRMQGENLNLATIVVLLGLVMWGAIWGLPGMFLSSPLTVLVMVMFNQSETTRWIAILLSADGRPELGGAEVTAAKQAANENAETS